MESTFVQLRYETERDIIVYTMHMINLFLFDFFVSLLSSGKLMLFFCIHLSDLIDEEEKQREGERERREIRATFLF